MLLNPHELAKAMSETSGENLAEPALRELAWALGNGQGVAIEETTVFIVLSDPLATRDNLTVVKGVLSTSRPGRKARPVAKMIGAFLMECGCANKTGPPPTDELWIPEIVSPNPRGLVGGALQQPLRRSFGNRIINWYNIEHVPIGGLVYFFRHPYKGQPTHLAVYQRVQTAYYGLVEVASPSQWVDVRALATNLSSGKTIEGIARMDGTPRLMRRGPQG